MASEQPIVYLRRLLHQSPNRQFIQMIRDRDAVYREYGRLFHPDNLGRLSAEDFAAFLLYENNRHWWGIHRHRRKIVSDMPRLRTALSRLLDEAVPIEERLDWIEPGIGEKPVPGLGKAVFTPIMHVVYPDRYCVWNSIAESAMKRLGLWPVFSPGAAFGMRYVWVNEVCLETAATLETDLWTLDSLWWLTELDHDPIHHQFSGGEGGSSLGTEWMTRASRGRDTFVCSTCFMTKAGNLRSAPDSDVCVDCSP